LSTALSSRAGNQGVSTTAATSSWSLAAPLGHGCVDAIAAETSTSVDRLEMTVPPAAARSHVLEIDQPAEIGRGDSAAETLAHPVMRRSKLGTGRAERLDTNDA
jgi:hypothetical protein